MFRLRPHNPAWMLSAALASLLWTGCTPAQTASGSESGPVHEPAAVPVRPEPTDGMVEIAAGEFQSGLTEDQLMLYLSQTRLSYPGMIDKLRSLSTIPPVSRHQSAFHIGRFEVTNKEFKAFLDASGFEPSDAKDYLAHWTGRRYPAWAENFPVVWVSQADAAAYCTWRLGQLPSEGEWEKAARGFLGTQPFPWGPPMPEETSNLDGGKTEPVGDRPGDVSPYQVFDMGGNVAEFTRTRAGAGSPAAFVVKGGSYRGGLRSALVGHRFRTSPQDKRHEDVGFRCVAYTAPGE